MINKITYKNGENNPNPENQSQTRMSYKKVSGSPSEGSIAKTIGAGDNAKNSIVWVTIRWSFIIGAVTSLAMYLRPTYCQVDMQGNLLEDIKSSWGIFMPVITLALGYIFGKGR